MKKCAKCGLEKPDIDFNIDRAKKDGLSVYCKNCKSIYNKQFRENDPDIKKKTREWNKSYREKNREKYNKRLADKMRKYRASNPEKFKEKESLRSKERRYTPLQIEQRAEIKELLKKRLSIKNLLIHLNLTRAQYYLKTWTEADFKLIKEIIEKHGKDTDQDISPQR